MAFSSVGKTLATASFGQARLWDAATARPLLTPLPHPNTVMALAFSPDGKSLATASWEQARLWDTASARPLGAPMPHSAWVMAVAFSPDGKILATGSGHQARLWDLATARPLATPMQHPAWVNALAFSPDGKALATASGHQARLWDPATARPLATPLRHQGPVHAVAFGPDGKTLVTGSSDGTARLWDSSTAQPLGPPLQHRGPVRAVAFSPDGRTVATGSDDAMARLWDVPTPVAGDPDRIVLWTEVLTNMELDSSDATVAISGRDWDRRRQDLETRAGPPIPRKRDTGSTRAWYQQQAASSEEAGQWFAARWHLDRLIAATPEDGSLYARRGRALAELGRWADADADFARATERGANVISWFYHALLRLHLGDIDGYRTACAQMLERFERSQDHGPLRWLVITGDLAPEAVADPGRLVRAAEHATALSPKDHWNDEFLGRALYRAGRYEEAVERLTRFAAPEGGTELPYVWLFLAMAHHGLRHSGEARTWLGKAETVIDQELAMPSGGDTGGSASRWSRRIELSLLRREAKTLIEQGWVLYLPANVFRDGPPPK
jgi:Flp pilus assembly protein TadD/sugar lactone lactonase YvrE